MHTFVKFCMYTELGSSYKVKSHTWEWSIPDRFYCKQGSQFTKKESTTNIWFKPHWWHPCTNIHFLYEAPFLKLLQKHKHIISGIPKPLRQPEIIWYSLTDVSSSYLQQLAGRRVQQQRGQQQGPREHHPGLCKQIHKQITSNWWYNSRLNGQHHHLNTVC